MVPQGKGWANGAVLEIKEGDRNRATYGVRVCTSASRINHVHGGTFDLRELLLTRKMGESVVPLVRFPMPDV